MEKGIARKKFISYKALNTSLKMINPTHCSLLTFLVSQSRNHIQTFVHLIHLCKHSLSKEIPECLIHARDHVIGFEDTQGKQIRHNTIVRIYSLTKKAEIKEVNLE